MERNCANCMYWQRDGGDGICRRYAPKATVIPRKETYIVVWPKTNDSDWCGEFKPYGVNLES